MFAVVCSGGKQYRVAPGDVIVVDKIDTAAGGQLELNEILLVGNNGQVTVGSPTVDGVSVRTKVLEQRKGDTITVFKKKRRNNYRRTYGHRQEMTVLRVTEIVGIKEEKKGTLKKDTVTTKSVPTKKAKAKPTA